MTDFAEIRRSALLRSQAALDGELDAANLLAHERDLAGDEGLRRAHASAAALRATLRAHVQREAAPEALRRRVLALAEPQPVRRGSRPRFAFAALAASVVALAFVAGYWLGARPVGSGQDLALRPIVDSFARAGIAGQPFDVASSDRHTVKPWLASRLTQGAEVVDLADIGFPLGGGRLDIVEGAPVPTLVYRRREHWIDVTELPLRMVDAATAVETLSVDGFRLRIWRDATRAYVAVSDIDAGEFDAFVEAFRRKVNQGVEPAPG